MSPMNTGSMPRPSAEAKAAFQALLPVAGDVAARPMFGNLSGFVNGNMFCGIFGDELFVRLAEEDRGRVLAAGGAAFSPMPGRAMQEYVTLPGGWLEDVDAARIWIDRALEWSRRLPPKTPRRARRR